MKQIRTRYSYFVSKKSRNILRRVQRTVKLARIIHKTFFTLILILILCMISC